MKRVIREVITIIKVERWLVEEDAPSLAETAALSSALPPRLSTETPLDPEIIAALEENVIPTTVGDGSKIVRVISQRVIDRTQYRVK